MKRATLLLVLVIVFAFAAFKMSATPATYTCGNVKGGSQLIDKGITAGSKAGAWIRRTALTRIHDGVDKSVRGVERIVIDLWLKSFIESGNGRRLDPQIIQVQRQAQAERDAANTACSPCPTVADPNSPPQAPPSDQAPFDPKQLAFQQGGRDGGEQAVWDALRQAGMDPIHTAGVMGNVQVESAGTFSPTIVQGGGHSNSPSAAGGGGYGLVQWTPGSKLKGYIGNAQPTVANEVAALMSQLRGQGPSPEGKAGQEFFAASNVDTAAQTFHLAYERSRSKDSTQRIRNARRILNSHSGDPAPTNPGATVDQLPNASIGGPPTPTNCQQGGVQPSAYSTGDLSGTITQIATLNPAGAGNWQGAVQAGGYWYVAHATRGDRTQVFHRLNARGVEVDQMVGYGFAHATSFAVVGTTVYASDIHYQIRSFPYQPGKTVRASDTTKEVWRGYISKDPAGRNIVIRNGNKYQAYDFTTGRPVGVLIRTDTGPRQGFSISGSTVYVLTGPTNQAARIDSYSTSTGQKIGSRDITSLGANIANGHREPEGAYGNWFGVKLGNGSARRLHIYQIDSSGKPTTVIAGVRTVVWQGRRYPVQIPAGPRGRAINFALDQLGDKYVWGAHGPDAWDCSGLTAGAWKAAGVTITPQSASQYAQLQHVAVSKMQPGDILWHPGHVQLYIGIIGGKRTVVEAPNPRKTVRIDQSGWMDIQAVLRPKTGVSA